MNQQPQLSYFNRTIVSGFFETTFAVMSSCAAGCLPA